MHKLTDLHNGVKVCTIRMPNMKSISLGVWIAVGGRFEDKRLNGISHFLEHLLFKGTKQRDYRQIKEEIEGVGGLLNAFTSEELTCLIAKVVKNHIASAASVLCDMCTNALLSKSDIDRERPVILEEIKMYMDMPSQYVHELMIELLWPKHPLGRPLAGTFETVSRITGQDILNFRDKYYVGCNITIVAAGSISHDLFVGQIKKHFANSLPGEGSLFNPVDFMQNAINTKFYYKPTEQTHLSLGFPACSGVHPDRHALNLLHIILGANMSSRLFNEVRERLGLAYEIGTGIKRFKDTGAFYVHAGVENSKLHSAVTVILKELAKIKKFGVRKDELHRAKEYYSGQTLLSLEDTMNYMLWCGDQLNMHGRFIQPAGIIRQIKKITARDLKRVANELFQTKRINLAVVGPQKEKEIKKIQKSLSI
ncbi:MAG: pitrilysin family protein [Candidatus Omnitrophota bacterium]